MTRIKLHDKIFEKYLSRGEILNAVKCVAGKINDELRNEDNPLFLGVLNGSFMFVADLMKHIEFDCSVSFVKMRSYSGLSSDGSVSELIGLTGDLTGRTVVLVEDVIDSGTTLEHLVGLLSKHPIKQLKICTLLFKPTVYGKDIGIDFAGINIPDDFIVGYGLDYNEAGRHYPDIYKIVN